MAGQGKQATNGQAAGAGGRVGGFVLGLIFFDPQPGIGFALTVFRILARIIENLEAGPGMRTAMADLETSLTFGFSKLKSVWQ